MHLIGDRHAIPRYETKGHRCLVFLWHQSSLCHPTSGSSLVSKDNPFFQVVHHLVTYLWFLRTSQHWITTSLSGLDKSINSMKYKTKKRFTKKRSWKLLREYVNGFQELIASNLVMVCVFVTVFVPALPSLQRQDDKRI